MADGAGTVCGGVPVGRDAQCQWAQATVDASEPQASLDPADGAPAPYQHRARLPCFEFFTSAEEVRRIEDIDTMPLAPRSVRARLSDPPGHSTISDSAMPSHGLPAAEDMPVSRPVSPDEPTETEHDISLLAN